MRILVVAATSAELAPFTAGLIAAGSSDRLSRFVRGDHEVDVLITGVGIVATATWCTRVLASSTYALAFNLGVCGSFDAAFGPGRVVHVVSDALSELGAEDGDAFLSAEELGLTDPHEFPFHDGRIENETPPANKALATLPRVRGITVSTAHGEERSIARVVLRTAPQVESMEGAAFLYSCLTHGVPCAQVRAVSNIVERRNRAAWRLDDAIANLGVTAISLIDQS